MRVLTIQGRTVVGFIVCHAVDKASTRLGVTYRGRVLTGRAICGISNCSNERGLRSARWRSRSDPDGGQKRWGGHATLGGGL